MLNLEGAQAGLSWITILRSGELPGRVRQLRRGDHRPLRRRQDRGVAGKPGHRAQPAQGQRRGEKRLPRRVQDEFGSFDAYITAFVDSLPIVQRGPR
ncbi:MAG: hypothetical protein R3A10_09680 [Caldilineaceae bacterium]